MNLYEFLETIKYLNLSDIKNLCKTNKTYMNYCQEYKHLIFKDIVYVLVYTYYKIGDIEDSLIVDTIGIFKNINEAINLMKLKYTEQINQLENININNNNSYTYSFNDIPKLSRSLAEDNGDDDDQLFNWKIQIKKLI